jgi:hypothetical protein
MEDKGESYPQTSTSHRSPPRDYSQHAVHEAGEGFTALVSAWSDEGIAFALSDSGMDALTAALEARPVRDSLRSFLGRDDSNCEITRSVGALVQGSGGVPVYWTNQSDFDDIRMLIQGPSSSSANATASEQVEGRVPVGAEVAPARSESLRYYSSHTAPPPRWASQRAPTYIRALYKR